MLSVVVPKIVFDQVPPGRLTGLMGGVLAGYPLGFALALLFLPLLGAWRLAMGVCALLCAVAFVAASAIITRSAVSRTTSASGFRLAPGTVAPLLLISLVWALYNGGSVILFSFVPAFFVAHGMSLAHAGAMTSLCLYTMIPVAPFGGWLFVRSVGVTLGILVSLTCMAAVPLLLLTSIPPAALMIGFGAIVGLSSGPIFALAGQGLRPEERALAMGILMTIFNLTMAVAPPLVGFASDVTSSPVAAFYVAAAVQTATLLVQIVHCVWRRTVPVTAA